MKAFTEGHELIDVRSLGLDGADAWMRERSQSTSYALKSVWEFFKRECSREGSFLANWLNG